MKKTKKINWQLILSASIAIFGVFSLIMLEDYLATQKHWAITCTIATVGIIRFYLFFEGSQLTKVKPELGKKAFYLSVTLTVLFIVYVISIYYANSFEPYLLYLFLIGAVSLTFCEWVFSKRIEHTESPAMIAKDRIEKALRIRLERLRGEVSEAKAGLKALEVKLSNSLTIIADTLDNILTKQNALGKANGNLSELANQNSISIETLTIRLNALGKTAEYGKHLLGKLLIEEGRKYAVCPNCFSETNLPSNKARHLICQHELENGSICNTELWRKKESVSMSYLVFGGG